jgi:primosomal protein N' (replication factor Y)
LLLEVLRQAGGMRGIIVLVPEITFLKRIFPFLDAIFGERLCVLHSKLGKRERAEAVRRVISGKADVVLGTRSAILAPLRKTSFIAVIEEQSQSYKGEEGLRYHARDLAVMKAFIDKSCVLLSSACPSIESVYNVKRGKYGFLNGLGRHYAIKRPRVKIVSFKSRKHSDFSLSPDVITECRSFLNKKERVLFLVGRKGYSLVRCNDCGHIESCPKCLVPMIFYKSSGMLKCHHCCQERKESSSCAECGGYSLKLFSAGTERVTEDIESLLKSPSFAPEKTKISAVAKESFGVDNPGLADFAPFVIGTSAGKGSKDISIRYSSAVLMNIDLLLARPDFRSHERAFQELIDISQLIKPGGSILIQTKSPGSKVLKSFKNYDFDSFYEMELAQRKELDYPPYARMIMFFVLSKSKEAIPSRVWQAVREIRDENVIILGPLEVPPPSPSHQHCVQIILKSSDNKKLHSTAIKLLLKLGENKRLKFAIDVDPLKI